MFLKSFLSLLVLSLIVVFYSLIIASRAHPLPILKDTLPLLAPSSPFVVYCDHMEPLVECFNYVISKEIALRVTLVDPWLREYQTLPGRVHPHMFGSASGGYVLYGIYVGSTASDATVTHLKPNLKDESDQLMNGVSSDDCQ